MMDVAVDVLEDLNRLSLLLVQSLKLGGDGVLKHPEGSDLRELTDGMKHSFILFDRGPVLLQFFLTGSPPPRV